MRHDCRKERVDDYDNGEGPVTAWRVVCDTCGFTGDPIDIESAADDGVQWHTLHADDEPDEPAESAEEPAEAVA